MNGSEEVVDFYRVMQVDPAADPEIIKAAYRVLARKLHPDLTGDESGMKRLNTAWDVLRDPAKRTAYDAEREAAAAEAGQPFPSRSSSLGGSVQAKSLVDDHAGPPPGNAYGPIVTFGRYEGWSIGEIARVDKPFLEWLKGVQAGRHLTHQINELLHEIAGATGTASRFSDGRLPEHRDLFAR
jgi:curved DNA-binding protein CbpA